MKLYLLTISSCLYIACGQFNYELEFLEEKIFSPCESYPNNFFNNIFDTSHVNIEHTQDGSVIVNGYAIITANVENQLPFTIEVFKKERGTWQPTIYSQKRSDACTACFDKTEVWHSYFKNTPEEQLKCPFTEGQRLDLDVNEPTFLSLPVRNGEGEFKIQAKAGSEGDDFFGCVNIFVMVHKM